MLYEAKVYIFSDKYKKKKHTHTVWLNVKILNVKPVGASRKQ
jgi:hypothetical protein